MGRTILLNYPWASFVLVLCVVNLSNQTTVKGFEESFKELSNLILGKWADLDYKISEMDKKIRQIDTTTITNDINFIKQKINDMETKVEVGACGQRAPIGKDSEDPIKQIKTQTTEIAGEIKQIKRETTLFNTVVNSLTLTSNSISSKLDHMERELSEGLQDLKTPMEEIKQINLGQTDIKQSINDSLIKLINQDRNVCVAAIDTVILGQSELKQSMNATLEEINDLNAEKNLYNTTIENLTLRRTEMGTQLDAIQSTLDNSTLTLNKVLAFTQCDGKFFRVGSGCISVEPETLSWEDARTSCKEKGGDLASPTDISNLQSYLNNNGMRGAYWLGGSDVDTEGTFLWVTGGRITSGWNSGQPNSDSDCVLLDSINGLWDYTCTSSQKYICEKLM